MSCRIGADCASDTWINLRERSDRIQKKEESYDSSSDTSIHISLLAKRLNDDIRDDGPHGRPQHRKSEDVKRDGQIRKRQRPSTRCANHAFLTGRYLSFRARIEDGDAAQSRVAGNARAAAARLCDTIPGSR